MNSSFNTSPPPQRRFLLLLLLLAATLWFGNLDYRKLVAPDEGRYAEIPREMVVSGDWLTPRLNNLKYFEKPALQYWATAIAYTTFGEHDWTARLWPALTGFLGILLAFYTGLKLFGRQAGLYAAMVLGSSMAYVAIGHINTLDMGMTFFMQLALSGVLLANRDNITPRKTRNWMLVAWAALGCAILSKGLIGIVLPGAALFWYSVVARDLSPWKKLHVGLGLPLFLIITVPWFVAVSLANPEFFDFFFIHEHFQRFFTKVHHRYQPPWYFLPILALGLLPWFTLWLHGLRDAFRKTSGTKFQPKRMLLVWSVLIFVFFSLSSSKLPSYILPIFPALALLLGDFLPRISRRALTIHAALCVAIGIAALILTQQVGSMADSLEASRDTLHAYAVWLQIAAVCLTAGAALAAFFAWRGRQTLAITVFALTGLIATQITISGHETLNRSSSGFQMAEAVRSYAAPDVPFYSVRTYEQTLPFYLKRPITLVEFQDEMAFGIQQEPDKWVPNLGEFIKRWGTHQAALALIDNDMYKDLRESKLPMEIIYQDPRRIVVRKPQVTP